MIFFIPHIKGIPELRCFFETRKMEDDLHKMLIRCGLFLYIQFLLHLFSANYILDEVSLPMNFEDVKMKLHCQFFVASLSLAHEVVLTDGLED